MILVCVFLLLCAYLSHLYKTYTVTHWHSTKLTISGAEFVLSFNFSSTHLVGALNIFLFLALGATYMPLLCAMGKEVQGRSCQVTAEIQRYSQPLGGQYEPLIPPLSSNNISSFPRYEQLVSKQVFLFFQGKDSRPDGNGSPGCRFSRARLIWVLLISLILPCYLNAFIYCRTL